MIMPGTVLRPAEINLLAAFGRVKMSVYCQPKVAILSTGDELVAPGGGLQDRGRSSTVVAILWLLP